MGQAEYILKIDEDTDIFIFTVDEESCSNWVGELCRIPRTAIQKQYTSLKKFQQAGVYFLVGKDEEGSRLKTYIGQAEDLIQRTKQHDSDEKKKWFEEVFFLISKRNPLNSSARLYLERKFHDRVNLQKVTRDNGSTPPGEKNPKSREYLDNRLIKPVPLLMKVLGRDIFYSSIEKLPDPVPGVGIGKMEYWHLSTSTKVDNKKCIGNAFCRKDEGSGAYIVCKGSKIVPWNVNDDKREKTGEKKDLCDKRKTWATSSTLTLPEDVPFTKKSPAAQFVTGRESEGGNRVWKSATEEDYRRFLENTAKEGIPSGMHLTSAPPTPNIFQPIEPEPYEIFKLDNKIANKHGVKNISFKVFSTGGKWKKTTVLKGGVIAEKEYPDNKPPEKEAQTKRKSHFTAHPGQCRLEEDWEFNSPTAAVSFVMGYFKGGPEFMIREGSGETLKAFRDAQK